MAEINKLSVLLSVFIAVLLGIVLVDVIADNIYENRNLRTESNETLAVSSGSGSLNLESQAAYSSTTEIQNGSALGAPQANYLNTFNITSDGTVTTNETDGNYIITYVFEPPQYVTNSTARTLMSIIVIFFVLGIVAMAMVLLRKMGIL